MKDIIKWALAAFLILVVYSYAVQQHLLPSLSVIFAQPAAVGMPLRDEAPAAQVAPVARIVQPRATQTPASPTAEAPTAAPVPTDAPRPAQPTQAPHGADGPTERSSEPVIPTAQPLPTVAPIPAEPTEAPAAEPDKPVVVDARTLGVPTPAPVANAGESDVQPVPQPQARTQYTANLVDGENNGLVATYTYQVCPIAGKLDNGVTCELAGVHGVVGTMGGRCNAYWQDGDPGAQTLILTHAPLCTPA